MSLDSLVISFFLIQRKPVERQSSLGRSRPTSVTFPATRHGHHGARMRKCAGSGTLSSRMVISTTPIILIEVQETTVKTCQNDCLLQLFVTVSARCAVCKSLLPTSRKNNISLKFSRLLATSAASACCVGAASHQKTITGQPSMKWKLYFLANTTKV